MFTYDINVSNDKGFLFGTKCNDAKDCANLLHLFTIKFPEKSGYSIQVLEWETSGWEMSMDEILDRIK